MISIEDCVELAIRGLEVYVYESEEILIQAAKKRQDRWFRSCKCFEEIKEREKIRKLDESSTWSVFEAD